VGVALVQSGSEDGWQAIAVVAQAKRERKREKKIVSSFSFSHFCGIATTDRKSPRTQNRDEPIRP
jgi:hypothetical protein